MNYHLSKAIKELNDFALANQHKAPARGYIRRWIIDLIEWEQRDCKYEFPAKKFYAVKRWLYTHIS